MKKLGLLFLLSFPAFANPDVRWYYNNWVIDNASVCYNHPKNSVAWRECRRYASLYFREQCGKYTRSSDVNNRKMFCTAASTYRPI